MMIKKGFYYQCVRNMEEPHGETLAFKEGKTYLCVEDDTLIGESGINFIFNDGTRTSNEYFIFGEPIDLVNNPPHYKDGGIETADFINAKGLNWELGNAVKYISRAGKKDPAKEMEDLEKAIWYINRQIKHLIDGRQTAG